MRIYPKQIVSAILILFTVGSVGIVVISGTVAANTQADCASTNGSDTSDTGRQSQESGRITNETVGKSDHSDIDFEIRNNGTIVDIEYGTYEVEQSPGAVDIDSSILSYERTNRTLDIEVESGPVEIEIEADGSVEVETVTVRIEDDGNGKLEVESQDGTFDFENDGQGAVELEVGRTCIPSVMGSDRCCSQITRET